MPRRQFVADLQKAQNGVLPPGVHGFRQGEDDGQFEFEVATLSSQDTPVTISITAMIPDVSEYPAAHEYMIFCGDDAPPRVAQTLQTLRKTSRKTVFELIEIVAASVNALAPRSADADGDVPMEDQNFNDEDGYDEDEDEDDVYADDDESFSFSAPAPTTATAHFPTTSQPSAGAKGDQSFRDRVRSDIRAAKAAGFKVGHLGSLLHGYSSFVTISIRISKLGISTEALQAWQVDPSEYLILIIQYPNGYKTNEQLQAYNSICLKPNVGMRVLAGKNYKPTLQEAISVFTKARKDHTSSAEDVVDNRAPVVETTFVHDTFISTSLATLLQNSFVPILRFRSVGMDWSGAEAWYQDMQNTTANDDPNAIPDRYYEPESVNKAFPKILHDDQYRQQDLTQYSFPLLAMQFTLRHFARCTEFCMVCHTKLVNYVEAIKPYVCDRPLCLFQYMSLGFGPSIEHEIIAQPYVVDLLISFCYSSAKANTLKDFPDGLSLRVPPADCAAQQADSPTIVSYAVKFDSSRSEVMFTQKPQGGCPVARGQWIVMKVPTGTLGTSKDLHCRILDTSFYPTISVNEPVSVQPMNSAVSQSASAIGEESSSLKNDKPVTPAFTPRWVDATMTTYCQEFNELDKEQKCQAICKLLATLPSVDEMRKYLAANHPTDLKGWVERISRDSANLLRWIIASNRACIMQVENGADPKDDRATSHKQERLHGFEGHMQFRFAMGAPDKESRFVSEVRKTAERLDLKHPTIFAFHGSPLSNWHMIIREGLHFKNADHGRAYGDGVYHASDANTSFSYSGMSRGGFTECWPKSMLRISSAIALNEIVNAPGEFVSKYPYYVVDQLDWIQTRYLFVKCAPTDVKIGPGLEAMPGHVHPQDPQHTPSGPTGVKLTIPASAIKSYKIGKDATSSEKRRSISIGSNVNKKLKDRAGDSIAIAIDTNREEAESVDTDIEDLEILFPDNQLESADAKDDPSGNGKANASTEPSTDFVPCSLDFSTLPLMPTPTYASSSTTKRLLTELKALNKIQSATPMASLGWSIDNEKIDNVYQWIVELHSFHTFSINNAPLPLVGDMKKANAKSIVLEIRFGPDFPYSPPYIRVIRPRFLPFTQGGGGHIVIGGAMCMELLTNTGWSSVMSMESVLMQVRMAIASEPFARLNGQGGTSNRRDYGAAEAAEGYLRACASHGWKVPPGFKEIAYGVGQAPQAPDSAGAGSF